MDEADNINDEILQYYANPIRKKVKDFLPYNPIDNITIINDTILVTVNILIYFSDLIKKTHI